MKKFLFLFLFSVSLIFLFLPQILSNFLVKTLIEKSLSQKYLATVSVGNVEFSWQGPQTLSKVTISKNNLIATAQKVSLTVPFWKIENFKSHIQIDNIQISSKSDQNIEFENGVISIENQKILSRIITSSHGSLEIDGSLSTADDFNITVNIQNFPSQILDLVLPKISCSQVLGDFFSCVGDIAKKSKDWSLKLQVSSPNLTSDVELKTEQNKITLLKPFILKTICQDYCQKQLLLLGNQEFIKSVSFYNPISVTVQEKDFVVDLTQSKLLQSQISETEISLGKIQITTGKKLNPLLQLFQKAKIGPEISLWLTPAVFSLNEGILDLKRIDILINHSFSIFCWGQADLINHSLNMTLAIPASTISKIYGISNIPPKYNLLIKVSGTFENPIFDVNSALAKLAIISGIKQGVKQIPGLGGKILNNTLDIFNEKIENVPPPSRPIPW